MTGGERDQDARGLWQEKLEFFLAEQAAASDPEQKFQLKKAIEGVRARLRELDEPEERRPRSEPALRIDIGKLPAGAPSFLGREAELALLDAAWVSGAAPSGSGREAPVRVVELIAPGGVGKTALVKRWLDNLQAADYGWARWVYGWSFFSQGAREQAQASEDQFLAAALEWLAVEHDKALVPEEKGRLLAGAMATVPSLLILDGIEPLQYPPGPMAGELRAPGLKVLLTQLSAQAGEGRRGLVVLTSRVAIAELAEHERGPDHPRGPVRRLDLENLSHRDGARLLHRVGCRRAGDAAIGPEDAELIAAAGQLRGHALSLQLLGRYLAEAERGDIRKRDTLHLREADSAQGGHAFQVIAAYETWLARAGEKGSRELAALRLLGYFDRPVDAGCLGALRSAPPVPGLTEPLQDLSVRDWNLTLSRLAACGLIERGPTDGTADTPVDAHPLVREYLAARLREQSPDAWREGHRRLYEHLKASAPHRPDGLAGLQRLYQAVAHGCLAGLHQQALAEVYRDRILRGTGNGGFYSWRKLGAVGANLGAVACFFDEPWQRVSPNLSEGDRAWLLNEAAFSLRALGRLAEALEPMRATLEINVDRKQWKNAAVVASNLSELELTLGRVADAVADAERSVDHADRGGDAFLRMGDRTTLADALHQQGRREPALARFAEAEAMQAERQPQYPLLYSLAGFRYCDLLLGEAERAAWRRFLALPPGEGDGEGPLDACRGVEQRAAQTLKWVTGRLGLLDIALDHLTLARAALLQSLLTQSAPGTPQPAIEAFAAAVDGLRAAGDQEFIARGLLPRAWLHALRNDPAAARADLDDAWRIASRGGMRLHMADIHLHRARLFRDQSELAKARVLIEECGYGRRKEELEDAERAARSW